jgi:hypothetical protein
MVVVKGDVVMPCAPAEKENEEQNGKEHIPSA